MSNFTQFLEQPIVHREIYFLEIERFGRVGFPLLNPIALEKVASFDTHVRYFAPDPFLELLHPRLLRFTGPSDIAHYYDVISNFPSREVNTKFNLYKYIST